MLVLLKTSKLVSKFENPTSGAESPFLQQRERFVDNLRRSSTSSSLLTVGCTTMVFNALQINSYVFSEKIGANAKKIRSVNKRSTLSDRHLQIANSASITSLAIHSGDVWVRACNVWLPRCPSYSMNTVVHIGKQRLSKPRDCHQILTYSRTKRRPAALLCEKCEW